MKHVNLSSKRLLFLFAWFAGSYLLALSLGAYLVTKHDAKREIIYNVFDSKPPSVLGISDSMTAEDSRAAIIDQYFANHKCPLEGLGNTMVETADKYGLPFWIIPAIAWQESTCGKAMIDGSFNPFGFGIYGSVVTKFPDWESAVDRVGRYLSSNFFSKGITDPCEIERTYTPPSKGRWCRGIKYFQEELVEYQTP